MMKKEIEINGKTYPCHLTMGAMLRFKDATGQSATSINADESLAIEFMYCVVKSASSSQKVDFELSLQDFADSLSPADFEKMGEIISEGQVQTPVDKKK